MQGPRMSRPRYQAAIVTRPGFVWVLGGRDGSHILRENEILYYPGTHITGYGDVEDVTIKTWAWAHARMITERLWIFLVPGTIKQLPMPLAGHCAVDIRNISP